MMLGRLVGAALSTSTVSLGRRQTTTDQTCTRAPRRVEPPKKPEQGYHFDDDIATHAIEWVRQQKALMPDKPFFLYFAPGGTHAPHAVPAEWSTSTRVSSTRVGTSCARRDPRPPEAARRHSRRGRAHRTTEGDPSLGRGSGHFEACAGAPDGGLCWLHGAH